MPGFRISGLLIAILAFIAGLFLLFGWLPLRLALEVFVPSRKDSEYKE
jgi:hypothetical protein